MIGAVAATREARGVGWVSFVGAGIGSSFGLERIVATLEAGKAVAEPRLAAIPPKSASKLASVAGAGLLGAGHGSSTIQIEPPSL